MVVCKSDIKSNDFAAVAGKFIKRLVFQQPLQMQYGL
jgi:hypothetical protein